ncbi:hypothetical protein KUV57_13130 [Epibacterium sp. DP7N7-1]|nr:hypothetical protein [Epibacterium sp. DP7N7-1]
MDLQHEADSMQLRQDTDLRALVILDIGMRLPHQYSRNDRTYPAQTAFQSQVLVRDLLKLGLFCMNIPSMAGIQDAEGTIPVSFARIPESILGIGLRYAIQVSAHPSENDPILQIDDLEKNVKRIEAHFGPIDVDMGLVARVAQCAREASLAPELSA